MRRLKKRPPLKKALKGRKEKPPQTLSEFDDIAVYFSSEEWGSLEETQKELYRQVMMDNYQTYTSGHRNKKPKLISCLERGKDPSVTGRGKHLKASDASNNRTGELTTSLFTPDGLTVEGIHFLDDLEEDLHISLKEDSVTNKRKYNFRDRVKIEYSGFFDDEIRSLKRRKGVRVKLNSDELEQRVGGLYPCSECDKKYKLKSNLIKHQKLHTDVSCYVCLKCHKSFSHRCLLRRHERTHTAEKPYACPDCEKRFTESSTLQKHRRLHSGYKPYKCSECDKTFSISNYLIVHQRTHTGEKPYVCGQCGKSFTQSSALITHKRTHTGVRPYVCIECRKGFSTSSHLITHQRTHTGERPYRCEECGVAFNHSTHLVLHIRKHTGEKPFSCDKCKKKYSQRAVFLKHQKRFHVDE